jgi:crossover junction endodeoxyribonuclease RuvC
MRILGVDPSLNVTGYGVIESNGAGLRLVEGGVIAPARGGQLCDRLAELQRGLADVIASLHPDVMIVEEVFSQTAYPKTAILMAHARGALVCAAALGGLPVFDYAATRVKLALVGRGAASKAQVAAMVVQTLRLRRVPAERDVTDALALAITHARRTALGAIASTARR